jgi:hypothetical protein
MFLLSKSEQLFLHGNLSSISTFYRYMLKSEMLELGTVIIWLYVVDRFIAIS